MKRFRRAMLNGLTVGSLLLAVVVAGSWVRSYWKYDIMSVVSPDRRTAWLLKVPRGGVYWSIDHFDLPIADAMARPRFEYESGDAYDALWMSHKLPWFRRGRDEDRYPWPARWTEVGIPHAYLLALFAALPAIRFYRRIRRRFRVLPGHCKQCGYDLRATPERCPECGAVAAAEAVRG